MGLRANRGRNLVIEYLGACDNYRKYRGARCAPSLKHIRRCCGVRVVLGGYRRAHFEMALMLSELRKEISPKPKDAGDSCR